MSTTPAFSQNRLMEPQAVFLWDFNHYTFMFTQCSDVKLNKIL